MALFHYILLVFACPFATGQMFNSIAEMLNPQLLNAVFRNIGPQAGGQTVNVGTDDNFDSTSGGQTVNVGNDGNTDGSQDDGTLNFGLPQTMGVGGFPQPGGGFPPFGGLSPPSAGGTNQNLGQISQFGIGNTINVASPSQPGQSNNFMAGQLTQQGVGNAINVGQSQPQQGFASPSPPSSRNLNVGQLQQQGIGNTVNFGRPQQAQTTGSLPLLNTMVPQSFGAPAAPNMFFSPPPFQRLPNQFFPGPRPFVPLRPNFRPVPFFGAFPQGGMGFM